MTENKNRQCHVFYRTAQSFGEMIIPQAPPITIKTLEHFRRIIRERNHLSKNAGVVIVCWQMLEQEDEE